MRSYIVAMVLLFIAFAHPSLAQKGADAEVVVRVAEGAPLAVECALGVEQRAEWRLEGGPVPADMRPGGERPAAAGRVLARLAAPAARAAHAGRYTCASGSHGAGVRVLLLPRTGAAGAAEPAAPSAAPAPAPAGPPAAQLEDEALAVPFLFDVGRNFSLDCTPAPVDGEPVEAPAYSWRVNGTPVEAVAALGGRYRLEAGGGVLHLTERAREDDFGVYGCLMGGRAARAWRLLARPLARLPPNSNVVEGQQVRLTCKLIGKPYPNVTWTYRADEDTNATDALEHLGARGALADSAAGVPRGDLTLRAAERADAGIYACVPEREGAPAATVLRVKDMYAALWPFLGICLEVLVLCAIILVYERRRTKPDTDDSDTDNHDQ